MNNPDGLPGIAGDRKFIDAFYMHQKSKEELKNIDHKGKNEEKIKTIEFICFKYYLDALDHCFTKIIRSSNEETKTHYLDYIRWNRDIIAGQLDDFKCIPHLQYFFPTITEYENVCKEIIEENFQLATEDKGIVNQYVHAYECVQRFNENEKCGKKYKLALQHTGKLFINYVNILKTHGYTKELDRHDVTFADFQNEAKDLVIRLEDVDDELKKDVEEAFELFKDYCEFDDGCAKTNDELICKALELAHSRATENVLQTALRNIREAIVYIIEATEERIAEAWEVGKLFLNPISHPIETMKNVAYAIFHPVDTFAEFKKLAHDNPWKFQFIACSSLGISAAITLFGSLVAAPVFSIMLIGYACGSVSAVAASGKAAKATAKGYKEIALEKAKSASLIADNEEKGRKIAQDVLDNYIRREESRKAREQTEKTIRERRLEKEKQEERKRQIALLN
uniref:Uncharacterized protein n=1 Tax=Panagrolaimus sp. JU765 TaxID=591449 RepID=A0AC34RT42_9BILA